MNRIRRVFHSGWFLLAVTVINMAVLGWSLYLHFGADVVVHGVPLKNCTAVEEPGKRIWTCNP